MAGFENDKIFLLSEKEYQEYRSIIPEISCRWWLRSPGLNRKYAALINLFGSVYSYGAHVDIDCYVRPVIKFTDSDKCIDNKVYKCGYTWIVIDDEEKIAIAEFAISARSFDECDNDYSMSAIRDYLLKWYEDREEI